MPTQFPKYSFKFVTESYASKISYNSQMIVAVIFLGLLVIWCCLPFFKIQVPRKWGDKQPPVYGGVLDFTPCESYV